MKSCMLVGGVEESRGMNHKCLAKLLFLGAERVRWELQRSLASEELQGKLLESEHELHKSFSSVV